MNIQGLYNKAVTAKSADKFLTKYAEDLNKVEILKPILASSAFPTPKVNAICQTLWAILEKQQKEKATIAEQESAKAAKSEPKESAPKEPAAYTVTIFVQGVRGEAEVGLDDKGVELVKNCPTMQAAETWAENRMWDRGDALYAEVVANKLIGKNGAMVFKIDRQEAMFNKLKGKRPPECKKVGSTSGKLSFGVKVRNDHCHFSKG